MSWFSECNVQLSFHCFENFTVLNVIRHDPVIRMFYCLFIVLKISLFSMSSSHDPVIRMFHCLFIVLKISLFSMSSSHDQNVLLSFHCFENLTVFNLIKSWFSNQNTFHCLLVASLLIHSCHPIITWVWSIKNCSMFGNPFSWMRVFNLVNSSSCCLFTSDSSSFSFCENFWTWINLELSLSCWSHVSFEFSVKHNSVS